MAPLRRRLLKLIERRLPLAGFGACIIVSCVAACAGLGACTTYRTVSYATPAATAATYPATTVVPVVPATTIVVPAQ